MTGPSLLAGIEAGGTKFVLAVGPSPTGITARHTIPTTSPGETLARAAEWLAAQDAIGAIGIASFGPVQLAPNASDRGHILATPKPGWSHCDLAGYFAGRFAVPIGFDTDVNGAALAEYTLGAGKGRNSLAYVTVGTGIGGGLMVNGAPVHGAAHPEMGHVFPRRHPLDRDFAGTCPYHGDCLEGLASGPAVEARWGASLSRLPPDHEAHAIVASYLAQLCHTIFAATSTEVVVLGGGVMQTAGLLERVRSETGRLGAGYLPGGERHTIAGPVLGTDSGIMGAMLLAERERAKLP